MFHVSFSIKHLSAALQLCKYRATIPWQNSTMEDGEIAEGPPPREPRYAAEDLSPTSARELRGFYACSMAAEIFAVCGVGKFKSHFCLPSKLA